MSPDHVHNICLLGQGGECCRYLTADARGYHCAKLSTHLRGAIDHRAARMHAKGDNCDGLPIDEILSDGSVFRKEQA